MLNSNNFFELVLFLSYLPGSCPKIAAMSAAL
jgi:hypothetical protein